MTGRDAECPDGSDGSARPVHVSTPDVDPSSEGSETVALDARGRVALKMLLDLRPEQVQAVRAQVSRRRRRTGRAGPNRDYGDR